MDEKTDIEPVVPDPELVPGDYPKVAALGETKLYPNFDPDRFYWPFQNPSWPEQKDMSVDELEARARISDRNRANSSNPRICLICGRESYDCQYHDLHSNAVFFAYRAEHGIAPDEPWTHLRHLQDPNQADPSAPVAIVPEEP